MNLLERYLATVEQELPAEKRQDVTRELRANILDQVDAQRELAPEQSEEERLYLVLVDLGPPRAMARRFHPVSPLIRDDHLPIYRHTLFLVFGVLFLIQMVFSSVHWLASEQMSLLLMLKGVAGGFIQDASFAFTVITIAFWLMGKQQGESCQRAGRWDPKRLPPLAQSWQRIGLDDIFSDLATYLFLLILIWYPVVAELPTAELLNDSSRLVLQAFSPLLVLGIILSVWQLRLRIWTKTLLQSNMVLNGLLVLAILILALSGPMMTDTPARIDWASLEQLNLSITITLLIIALFPGWEVVRDGFRLRKLLR